MQSWLMFVAIALLSFSVACQGYSIGEADSRTPPTLLAAPPVTQSVAAQPSKTVAPAQLIDLRLVNAEIRLDMRYATTNNFLHQKLYKQPRCLLRAIVAEQLSQVQADWKQSGWG